jgi:hypothetical protein
VSYKVREIVERELSADEFRDRLDVRPARSPMYAIGDIVTTCLNNGYDIEAGVIRAVSWYNQFEDPYYSYEIASMGRGEPVNKIEKGHFHENAIMVMDRIEFQRK